MNSKILGGNAKTDSWCLNRRAFLSASAVGYAALCSGAARVHSRDTTKHSVLDLKPGVKHLFLDDVVVAKTTRLQRVVHQPRKYSRNPVIRPEYPWEADSIQIRSGPLWNPEERRWEIRYFASGAGTCLAISRDGLTWEKPFLGRFEFQGSKENNLAHPLGSMDDFLYHVIYDSRDADPQHRWRALIGERNPRPAASPDGFSWEFLSEKRITSGEESFLVFDELAEEFVFTCRTAIDKGFGRHRAVNLSVSRDFVNWTEPELLFYADGRDQELGKKWLERHLANPVMRKPLLNNPDQWNAQVYNMSVFPYEGLYIGLPTLFRSCGQDDTTPAGDGFSEPGLTVSRDRKEWRYVAEDRTSFIPLSPVAEGVYDTAQIEAPARPIRVGDELWFYYSALKYRYSAEQTPTTVDTGSVCLAMLRLDGFVGLHAGSSEGTLVTRPLVWQGKALFINGDTPCGEIRVEILDTNGKPIAEEFSFRHSIPVQGDGVRFPVYWDNNTDLEGLNGKTVCLRFHLRNAGLYSFWTEL